MDFNEKYKKLSAQMDQDRNKSIENIQVVDAVESTQLLYDNSTVEDITSPVRGLDTGFLELDNLINGLRPRTCTILAADTGMGKSFLAIKMLTNIAKMGHQVCYFDLENGKVTTLGRVLALWHSLTRGWISDPANKEEVIAKTSEIKNFAYYSHDKLYDLGLADKGYELILQLMEAHAKRGTKVFLVDALQNFSMMVTKKEAKNILDVVTKKFMEFAQTHNVSILVCHHIRKSESGGGTWVKDIADAREVMYKIPTLEDVKGSSGITQTASDVWGLVRTKLARGSTERETKKEQGKSLLVVLKNRNGREGFVELFCDVDTMEFQSVVPTDPIEMFNKEGTLFDGQ